MSDIFISYAHEDRPRAATLAHALEAQGWSVWWDRTIPAGTIFDDVIEEALANAKCVIVLWSEKSITSDWVKTEAQEGADRKVLIPVRIANVRIPLSFRRIHAADLIEWNGDDTVIAFTDLIGAITGLLGSPPVPQRKSGQRKIQIDSSAANKTEKQAAKSMPTIDDKKKQLWNKMVKIVADQLGITEQEVTEEASFVENLGADSLDLVELVMAFEEEFEIEVPDEDLENLLTVGDVYRYGIKKLGL